MGFKFTFIDAAAAQRTLHKCATEVELSLNTAYEVASVIFDAQTGARFVKPTPPPLMEKAEPTVKRKPCLEHREKDFRFSDGTVMQSCSATDCYWRKKHPITGLIQHFHSDGSKGGTYPDLPEVEDPELEVSEDDPRELDLSPPTLTAGEEEPEPEMEEGVAAIFAPQDDDEVVNELEDAYEE
jgi:hypothetical protein